MADYDDAEARAAREWLLNADDAWLACRGNHNFPKMRLVDGGLPEGIRADRQPDRSYQITETCPDCGTKRIYSTVPGGFLGDLQPHYVYDWPDGYRQPKGASTYVTMRDCRNEVGRRVTEELDKILDGGKPPLPRRRRTRLGAGRDQRGEVVA